MSLSPETKKSEMKNIFKRYTTIFLAALLLVCSLVSCKKSNSYSVTVVSGEHGEVIADKTTVDDGDNVTFRITPDEKYVLKTFEVNGKAGNTPESGVYTLCDVKENVVVRAEFAKTSVTVNFDTDGKGQIAPITVVYGGKFGALPVPSSDLTFKGWYVSKDENAEKIVSTSRVNILGEITLYARYYEKSQTDGGNYNPYSITATYYDQLATKLGVSFHTEDETLAPEIRVAKTPDMSNAVTVDCETVEWQQHFVSHGVIDNLDYDTQYYYRMGDAFADVWSQVFSYKTRKNVAETSFLMIADTQQTLLNKNTPQTDANGDTIVVNGQTQYGIPETDTARVLADATNRFDYDYVLHVGDLINYSENMDYWREMLGDMQKYITSKPIVFTTGNHEDLDYYAGGIPDVLVKMFNLSYPKQSNVGRGLFYSLDIGCMHLVVLSTNDTMIYDAKGQFEKLNKLSDEQIEWLKNDLRQANADPEKKWTVVSMHEGIIVPTYASLSSLNNHQLWLRPQLMPIFDEYDVDVVFNGHNHYLDSTFPLVYDPTVREDLDGDGIADLVRIVTSEYTNEIETNEFGRAEKIDVFKNYRSGKDGTIFHQIGTTGRQFSNTFSASKLQENLANKHYYRNLLSGGSGMAIEGDSRTYSMYAYVQVTENSFTIRTYGVNYNTVYDYRSAEGEHSPLLDAIRLYK